MHNLWIPRAIVFQNRQGIGVNIDSLRFKCTGKERTHFCIIQWSHLRNVEDAFDRGMVFDHISAPIIHSAKHYEQRYRRARQGVFVHQPFYEMREFWVSSYSVDFIE